MKLQIQEYQDDLDSLNDAHNQTVAELAENFRHNVLVPLCAKHNLQYSTQFGHLFQFKQNGQVILTQDHLWYKPSLLEEELLPVWNLLKVHVGKALLCSLVSDITHEDTSF